jgi:hypothetical protein
MKLEKVTIIACMLTILTLSVSHVSAENLLINGDFETGDLTGWETAGISASSTITVQAGDNGPFLPGNNNAFLSNEAEALGLLLKQTTVNGTAIAGQVDYSFDLKLDQAEIGGVLFAQIFAEQEGVGIIGGSGLMGPFWSWNNWTTVTGSFVAPANTTFMTIQFVATTGAAIGTNCIAHVDNVVLDQGTVASEYTSWSGVKALFR